MGKGLFSDSKETVTSLSGLTPTILYPWPENIWRHSEGLVNPEFQTNEPNQIAAAHCSIDHPNLVIAHRLAKHGRLYGWDNWGSTEPIFQLEELYRKVFCLSYFCIEIFSFFFFLENKGFLSMIWWGTLKNKECKASM